MFAILVKSPNAAQAAVDMLLNIEKAAIITSKLSKKDTTFGAVKVLGDEKAKGVTEGNAVRGENIVGVQGVTDATAASAVAVVAAAAVDRLMAAPAAEAVAPSSSFSVDEVGQHSTVCYLSTYLILSFFLSLLSFFLSFSSLLSFLLSFYLNSPYLFILSHSLSCISLSPPPGRGNNRCVIIHRFQGSLRT